MMLKSKARRTSHRVEKVVFGVALYFLSGGPTAAQDEKDSSEYSTSVGRLWEHRNNRNHCE